MQGLARFSLILVIVLVSLSAYLRLAHSGLGCDDWPECYGRIGAPAIAEQPAQSPYQRLIDQEGTTAAWTTPLHRLVASLLGLAVLAMTTLAFMGRHPWPIRLITLGLLFLTIYLAMLGLRSGPLHDPTVVMGNLIGGFTMLALLGWLVFRSRPPRLKGGKDSLALWSLAGVVVLAGQILLGGLTSAHFGATSCATFPDCQGSWFPDAAVVGAFDLSPHEVSATGVAIGGPERAEIHKAHRLGALAVVAITIPLCVVAARRRRATTRWIAMGLACVLVLEVGIGAIAVLAKLPIGLAVLHNWLAGLMLLGMIWLTARLANSETGTEPAVSHTVGVEHG